MFRLQFRVLYREFVFSVVDRDLLSTHAKGDASRLLLQIVALLVCLSVCFCLPVFSLDPSAPVVARLSMAWTIEHFLIATTMLAVGLLSVLSWNTMFPGLQDVFVLGPLPIRAHTIQLARLAAVITALSLSVLALHAVAGVIWPLALNAVARGGPIHAPTYTYDALLPPVSATDLPAVLEQDLQDAIRRGPLAADSGAGLSIGVSQRGIRRLFSYGAATPESIFQIGSATKPFTGVLLAHMVETGRARLDEPVRLLIPDARLSRPGGSEITLLDLATHHSGLPGLPATFRPRDPANPLADFDVATLYAFLTSRGVERRPDTTFRYSNLGYGLLGHALSRRAGTAYAALLREVITEPLGLRDTTITLSPEQRLRLVQGYDDDRRAVPPWDFDVLDGAGGLRSTATDMLVWLEANLHPERLTGRTLAAAITASHEPRSSVDSSTSLGLAWLLHPNGEIEHGGSILGFTADAFFTPSEDLAAVVLSNVGPGTALSAELVGEHLRARLAGRPAVSLATVAIPQTGSVATWIRLSLAYWFTMAAAGVFVLGLAASVQGLAAAILPRRHFVRLSSGLQLATFCVVVGTYCFQPMRPLPSVLLAAQDGGLLTSSPSLWFLGLFQQLSGSPALGPLAEKAWLGLGLAVGGTVIAYGLSYVRAMRYIAEQPDVTATMAAGARWLPSFGSMPSTAIIHFSIRTLARSAQHRLIVAFYWGVGFAFAIFLIKAPRGQQLAEVSGLTAWHETGVPVLVSSVVMMAFAVVAARVAFAIPRDLSANWIFRIMPVGDARQLVDARRWALTLVSVVPVWTLYAITLPWLWPWQPALEHLLALAILGMTFVELAMIGPVKIPATCSYLPGKSHLHLAVCIAAVVLLPLAFEAAEFELAALQAPIRYVSMLVVLCIALFGLRLRTAWAARIDDRLTFDDEPADVPTTIELWDARVAGTSTTRRGPASG